MGHADGPAQSFTRSRHDVFAAGLRARAARLGLRPAAAKKFVAAQGGGKTWATMGRRYERGCSSAGPSGAGAAVLRLPAVLSVRRHLCRARHPLSLIHISEP